MKKVGIVTFHHAHNYGAVLQCLALKIVIKNLGYEVYVVDHRNKLIEDVYRNNVSIDFSHGILKGIKSFVKKFLEFIPLNLRIRKFNSFIDKYLLGSNKGNDSCNIFECIVLGSDQIWKWSFTQDKFYWGKCDNDSLKKLSYAASAGKLDKDIDRILPLVRHVEAISVREYDLNEYLISHGIKSEVTLDPTLLINKDQWIKNLPLYHAYPHAYILVYALRNRKSVLSVANRISSKENIPIIEIFNNSFPIRKLFDRYNHGDPIDFLSLINDANYVVTDSFHGTAFSVIFNKQFVTVQTNDGNDNRAMYLLNALGIPERMSESGLNYNSSIDYDQVNRNIDRLKDSSLEFLKRNLP